MNSDNHFSELMKPGNIGSLKLKNRIVMPPMGNRFCGVWGEVTEQLVEWYRTRARGGCGLIIVEATHCATAIDNVRVLPRVLRADDICYIPGLAALAEAIRENGARAGIQLSAGGGAQAKGGPWMPGLQTLQPLEPVSPSGIPALGRNNKPRILTVNEISQIIELCGVGAKNVKQAGFELIEVHAHGGYLISQFLSPYFNKRTDRYGGSLDNRCQFLIGIVASMRKAVGPDFPITVKYSIEDYLPGGWDTAQSKLLAQKLEKAGVDGIGVSSGVGGSKMPFVLPYFYPQGAFIPFSEAMKKVVSIPVLVGGRLNDPALANKTLEEGKADFIYEGRALMADPDWPKKVATGRTEEIRPCLSCNECRHCIEKLQSVRCAVNPVAGRERDYAILKPVAEKKKVMVVGGGPAGMEAAWVAASRGHEVTLYESRRHLGGLTLLGGVHNEHISAYEKWSAARLNQLSIKINLQTEVTPALVDKTKPDVVILATGGRFVTPDIPGIDRSNVFSASDLVKLMNGIPVGRLAVLSSVLPVIKHAINASTVRRVLSSNLVIKKRVAVIGGQFPGCSLALMLAKEGKKVVVIEEADQFGRDIENYTLVGVKSEIEDGNIKMLTSSKVTEITADGVMVADQAGTKTFHEADSVIIALELLPSDGVLAGQLAGKVNELYEIGDAKSFRRIKNAVSEGYVTGFYL